MIQRETALHQQNGNGEIIFKCNQLVDKHVIRALYRASMEGVRVGSRCAASAACAPA